MPAAAQQRSARILRLTSHWWSAYEEGAAIARSAEEARIDWSKVEVPIALLAVAQRDGPAESRERYRLYLGMVAASHALFLNPPGWRHDEVLADARFLPNLVAAVGAVVTRAALPASASSSPAGTQRAVKKERQPAHVFYR